MDDMQRQALILVSHIYLACGKVPKAIALLEGVRSDAKTDAYLPRALAFAYLRAGRHADALREAETAMAHASARNDRRCVLLLKAHALWGLGRDAERKAVVEQLLNAGAPPKESA